MGEVELNGKDSEGFVISTSRMVHRSSCQHVRDYADGRRVSRVSHNNQGEFSSESSGDYAEGTYVETLHYAPPREWVTQVAIDARFDPTLRHNTKYTRCQTCAPNVPEYMPRKRWVEKQAGSLTSVDLGRETPGGILSSIHHVAGETRLVINHQGISVSPNSSISFLLRRKNTESETYS